MAVVSNSSPLIAFAAIGQLDLLKALFSAIVIPPAVAREIEPSLPSLPEWIRVTPGPTQIPQAVPRGSLGDGEREAIALALAVTAERILLDDRAARRIAEELNLTVTGTAGVLLAAKRHDLLPQIRPFLDALIRESFFIDSELYEQLLRLAGESSGEST